MPDEANRVTLAMPSKGALADPTLEFFKSCDLKVSKTNPRQYIASISTLPHVDVLFQRVADIVYKVADGTLDIGITGLDVVQELMGNSDEVIILHDDLRYGECELVLAVPEAWIDVENMTDLADVALDFRDVKRRNLRVATKFTNLARRFLRDHSIHHFTLVEAEGAIEAAPTLGYADVIIDLSATGTTLRENHLKPLSDGVVLESTTCLIGNRRRVRDSQMVLDTARVLLEVFDATLSGGNYYQLTVNVRGDSAQSVANAVASNPLTRGLQGPTVAPIYAQHLDDQWFSATIIVHKKNLLEAISHLRSIGGAQTTVIPARYVFLPQSPSFQMLLSKLS